MWYHVSPPVCKTTYSLDSKVNKSKVIKYIKRSEKRLLQFKFCCKVKGRYYLAFCIVLITKENPIGLYVPACVLCATLVLPCCMVPDRSV